MKRKIEKKDKWIEFESEMTYGTERKFAEIRSLKTVTENADGSKTIESKKFATDEDAELVIIATGITGWGKNLKVPTIDEIANERDRDYKNMFREATLIIYKETFMAEGTEEEKKQTPSS